MRTREQIEHDIKEARSAYDAMASIEDAEPEGKGIFLGNCSRRIAALQKELEEVERENR